MRTQKTRDMVAPKTILAYRWSMQKLVEHCKLNHERLYFWTFTFVEKMPEHRYSYAWQGFIRDVAAMYRAEVPLYGVKVTEHHKLGGLHYHCIVNKRLPVGALRRIGKRYGIGWMWVKRCNDPDGACKYLEKYLSKDFDRRFLPGIRRWSTLGAFSGIRKNDVVMQTPASHALRLASRMLYNGGRIPFKDVCRIAQSKNIHAPEHLAVCIAHAKENKGDLNSFDWPWWYLEREAGIEDNPLDGKCPF